jgi:nitrogen regulatory protein PII-like uncharacterized protein
VSYENISPDEWEQSKIEASKRKVLKLEREEERVDVVINAIQEGFENDIIAKITGLTIERVEQIREEL